MLDVELVHDFHSYVTLMNSGYMMTTVTKAWLGMAFNGISIFFFFFFFFFSF